MDEFKKRSFHGLRSPVIHLPRVTPGFTLNLNHLPHRHRPLPAAPLYRNSNLTHLKPNKRSWHDISPWIVSHRSEHIRDGYKASRLGNEEGKRPSSARPSLVGEVVCISFRMANTLSNCISAGIGTARLSCDVKLPRSDTDRLAVSPPPPPGHRSTPLLVTAQPPPSRSPLSWVFGRRQRKMVKCWCVELERDSLVS